MGKRDEWMRTIGTVILPMTLYSSPTMVISSAGVSTMLNICRNGGYAVIP